MLGPSTTLLLLHHYYTTSIPLLLLHYYYYYYYLRLLPGALQRRPEDSVLRVGVVEHLHDGDGVHHAVHAGEGLVVAARRERAARQRQPAAASTWRVWR
eukprot:scaffold92424_cov60-Phaeocystis_antarctica.AAC.2